MNPTLRVLDLFCGAGGFSEGLRLAGFKPTLGIDCWAPAVHTYSANQNIEARKIDVLTFSNSIESIEQLPNTELIVGGPPCVSFSNSNKSGYADKTLGIELIQAFFRIVAVKKHKKNSVLEGWVMENVPKARAHIPKEFTFSDLNLGEWALFNGFSPSDSAILLEDKFHVLDSSEMKVPQRRKRLFLVDVGGKPINLSESIEFCDGQTLGQLFAHFPKPQESGKLRLVEDPNFPSLRLDETELTDHFYDTGIPARNWKESRFLKVNHPYMGIMSFPERQDIPARTVMATPFAKSRESMIFKCESGRRGDGEYRTPTVREAAVIMTFPIDYQFYGSVGTKWKLIGNAVCPKVSESIGFAIKGALKIQSNHISATPRRGDFSNFVNLNSEVPKDFSVRRNRKSGARFRRHTFKEGNMTVALANYDLTKLGAPVNEWTVYATYGTMAGYMVEKLSGDLRSLLLEKALDSIKSENGEGFAIQLIEELDYFIRSNVPKCSKIFQQRFEQTEDYLDVSNPITIVEFLKSKIETTVNGVQINVSDIDGIRKNQISLRQALTAYSLLGITDEIYGRN